MATLNAHLVDAPAPDTQATVSLHIDNMPSGDAAPGANSITTAMLQSACVNNDKLAQNAVGEGNINNNAVTTAKVKDGAITTTKLASGVLPGNATKETPGIVKQAAHVSNCASGDGAACQNSINAIIAALVDAGIMANA